MKLHFAYQSNSYSWCDQIKRPTRDFWPVVPGRAGLLLRGLQIQAKKDNPAADGSKLAIQVCSSTRKHLGPANPGLKIMMAELQPDNTKHRRHQNPHKVWLYLLREMGQIQSH